MTKKPFVHPLRDSLTPADLRLRSLLGAFRTSGAVPSGLLATHYLATQFFIYRPRIRVFYQWWDGRRQGSRREGRGG